jgi:hypothetical protein
MPLPAVSGLHQYFMNTACQLGNFSCKDHSDDAAGRRYDDVYVSVTESTVGNIKMLNLKGSADTTYQLLPYEENKLTYTKVSDKAKAFLTGPLSGCHVYVAKKGGEWYVFHVNANGNNASFDENVQQKRKMFLDAALQLGITPSGSGCVERQQYSHQKGYPVVGALVFGFEDSAHNTWRFFFSGFDEKGTVTLFFPLHVFNE